MTRKSKPEKFGLNAGEVYTLMLVLDGAKLSDECKNHLEEIKGKFSVYLKKKLK